MNVIEFPFLLEDKYNYKLYRYGNEYHFNNLDIQLQVNLEKNLNQEQTQG